MKLVINKDRSVIPVGTWGTVNENNYEILDFEFPAELEEYNKRIVYYLGDERVWDTIVNNKAIITNAITTKEHVKAYVWLTKTDSQYETDVDFRTQLFEMNFYENENADGIVPTEEQVDGFNTMLTAMNAKIDEVDALEQTIGAAEAQRQENENVRISNESTRESNESTRESNEQTRQSNEATRQTNEQTRQTQEAERERKTDEAIGNIEDKTAEYNANAEAKTNEFNQNATQKTNEFNSNYTQKTNDFNTNATTQKTDFNTNASSKTSAFNSNAETKTNAFNTNATNKTNAFNSNASEKTTAFDNNASTKTSEFNTNAESKTSAFNDNATQKTTNFDNNASEKTDEFNNNAQDKIDEYDEHIVDYQAQIDELQEEVEELSENMPWNTTEQATEISVTDAAKYSRNKLELFGNTKQASYTGKNLLPYPYVRSSETINGITFTDLGNGSIMINGTATKNAYFNLFGTSDVSQQQIIPGDYVYCENGNSNIGLRVMHTQQVGQGNQYITLGISRGMSAKIDLSTYTIGYVEVMVSAGATVNNLVVRPMITMNEDNDYEPYTGGQPSPSPNYPQDIHVVTRENTIKVQGKNLFSADIYQANAVIQTNGSTNYNTNDNVYKLNVKPQKQYTISIKSTDTQYQRDCRIIAYTLEGTYIQHVVTFNVPANKTAKRTFSTPANTGLIRFHIQKLSTDVQIEEGSTATDYVPYYHADYPINLGSIELCKLGDYQDYLYKENGNWYKYGAINKVILDGTTERWGGVSTSGDFKRIDLRDTGLLNEGASRKTHLFCSISRASTVEDYNIAFNYNNVIFFYLPQGITTGNEWVALLSQKLPKLYYILATPTTTQITDETLISQLDEIYEHLKLAKGTNNITVTAEDIAPYMELSYMQDIKSKLDNLDSRLALLE